jgi:lipoate---protein ligase
VTWRCEFSVGDPAQFLSRDFPGGVEGRLWWFQPELPTLILGSSQPASDVDAEVCAAHRTAVVRRRSGGGAVLASADDLLWVDVLIPREHAMSVADVVRSSWMVGECWREALNRCGIDGVSVHTGPMVHSRWSKQICFVGTGPGEVVDQWGRKVVGISQRRTRDGARLQCGLYRRWDAQLLASMFVDEELVAEDIGNVATVSPANAELVGAFEAALNAADRRH